VAARSGVTFLSDGVQQSGPGPVRRQVAIVRITGKMILPWPS